MLLVPIGLPAHLKAIALGALFVVVSFVFLFEFFESFYDYKDYRFFGGNAKSKGGSSVLSMCC